MNDQFFDLLTGAWKTQLLIAATENHSLPPRIQRAQDQVYPKQVHSPNMVKQMKRMMEYWKELPLRGPIPKGSMKDYRIYMEAQEEKAQTSKESFLKQVDFDKVQRLLDVGGGTAPYLREIQKQHPQIHTTYMDIEDAAIIAKEKGLKGNVIAGDFRELDWGKEYDLILLSQVIHMYDDESVGKLFDKASEALTEKGRLVVVEHFIDPEDDAFNFLFDINMYLGTDGGKCRTRGEVADLASHRFTLERKFQIDERTGVLEFLSCSQIT